jgi:hypothetical protein
VGGNGASGVELGEGGEGWVEGVRVGNGAGGAELGEGG